MTLLPFRPGQPVRAKLGGALRPAEVICPLDGDDIRVRVNGRAHTVAADDVRPLADFWAQRHAAGGVS